MQKRTPRLHLEFDADLAATRQSSPEPPHLNAHLEDARQLGRPDMRRVRKRLRQNLHLLEGGPYDESFAAELDEAA